MNIYIIAGEASGDLHASNLMKEILIKGPDTTFRYWGGDKMSAVQGKPVKHIKDLAFMGFIEVVANLKTILGNIKLVKQDILANKPDAILLVDYPGFNMRIAAFAKEHKIPVHYYISPSVWAWKPKRGFKMKAMVDELYCILPFEKAFYKENYDMEVHYVGHPLLDAIKNFQSEAVSEVAFKAEFNLDNRPIIALLPGSRKQEIKVKLPIMLEAAKKYPAYQLIVAGAPNLSEAFYKEIAAGREMSWISNRTYDLLNNSHAGMVTSGTATLETALFNVPQVVCYKGSAVSYQIAKRLIKVDYISLPNLIMNQKIVSELIQNELTVTQLQAELDLILGETDARKQMLANYQKLFEILGSGGASKEIASLLLAKVK
jgi:lipid-A-disaccharide synthase